MKRKTILLTLLIILAGIIICWKVAAREAEGMKMYFTRLLNNIDSVKFKNNNKAILLGDDLNYLTIEGVQLNDTLNLDADLVKKVNLAILMDGELPYMFFIYGVTHDNNQILIDIVKKDVHNNDLLFYGKKYIFVTKNGKYLLNGEIEPQ